MDGLKIYPLQSSRWAEGMRALSFVLLLLSSPFGEPHEYFFPLLSLVRGGTLLCLVLEPENSRGAQAPAAPPLIQALPWLNGHFSSNFAWALVDTYV